MNPRQINFQKHNEKVIKEMAGENSAHDKYISKLIVDAKL